MNTGPGFTNVQNVPTVQQPVGPTVQQRIMANKRYLISLTGILHIALIIFQFAAWVSAAAVLKPSSTTSLPDELAATRSAYLFFSIVGWFIAIAIFLINFLNIISLGFFNRLPWSLITFATDALWILPTFVLAIVAAVRETGAKNLISPYSDAVNIGAFGSASFFAFLNTIIYVIDSIYHMRIILKGGANSPPPYAP